MQLLSNIIIIVLPETRVHDKHYVFDTLWSKAIPAEQRIQEIEKSGKGRGEEEEPAVSTETKIILEYHYQIFKKLEDSIEKNQINKKIRSMLQPIIQKQSRDTKRQLESIKQLQYQLKQLQKQLSDIQKSVRRTKKVELKSIL